MSNIEYAHYLAGKLQEKFLKATYVFPLSSQDMETDVDPQMKKKSLVNFSDEERGRWFRRRTEHRKKRGHGTRPVSADGKWYGK